MLSMINKLIALASSLWSHIVAPAARAKRIARGFLITFSAVLRRSDLANMIPLDEGDAHLVQLR